MKKKIFVLLTVLMFVVSGCSVSSVPVLNKILPKETVTKIVFQQSEKIDNLVDFVKKADALAKEKWAPDAMFKTIRFSNEGSFFTYVAEFTSNQVKTKEGKPGDLTIFYNYASDGIIDSDLEGLRVEDFSAKENSIVIGNSCVKSALCGNISLISSGEKIDPNSLKITSSDIDRCLKTFKNGTLIVMADRPNAVVPRGSVVLQCGLFRMNAYTGQMIAGGSASSTTLDSLANNSTTSTLAIATTTQKISTSTQSAINSNKDSDNDGLADADEVKYGTDSNNPDTDSDGYEDGDEVKNGFNPLGSGKLNNQTKDYLIGSAITYGENASRQAIENFYLANPQIEARDKQRYQDMKNMQLSLDIYFLKEGRYPEKIDFGKTIVSPETGDFISSTPKNSIPANDGPCSKDFEYRYVANNNGKSYDLYFCLGNSIKPVVSAGINILPSSEHLY